MSENAGQKFQVRDPQGNVYGPADVAMLRDWVGQGRIVAGMHIADETDGVWVEVSTHPALADLFAGGAAAVTAGGTGMTASGQSSPVTPVMPGAGPGTDLSYSPNAPKQNVFGLMSLIAGIIAALGVPGTCVPFCSCLAIPAAGLFGVVAVVLGIIGMMQVKKEPEKFVGKGMSMAGLILGAGAIVLEVIVVILAVVGQIAMHK